MTTVSLVCQVCGCVHFCSKVGGNKKLWGVTGFYEFRKEAWLKCRQFGLQRPQIADVNAVRLWKTISEGIKQVKKRKAADTPVRADRVCCLTCTSLLKQGAAEQAGDEVSWWAARHLFILMISRTQDLTDSHVIKHDLRRFEWFSSNIFVFLILIYSALLFCFQQKCRSRWSTAAEVCDLYLAVVLHWWKVLQTICVIFSHCKLSSVLCLRSWAFTKLLMQCPHVPGCVAYAWGGCIF